MAKDTIKQHHSVKVPANYASDGKNNVMPSISHYFGRLGSKRWKGVSKSKRSEVMSAIRAGGKLSPDKIITTNTCLKKPK